MIYDCFLFFNELDILELRLNELNDIVDYFVIAEANKTHAGQFKPLHFWDNKDRFSKFLPKIKHVLVDSPEADPWTIERHQRESLTQGLINCQPDDVIMGSDVDEIPRPHIVKEYNINQGLIGLELDYSFYYLNCTRQQKGTTHFRIMPFSLINTIADPQPFSITRYCGCPIIENAGWHFSFLGGIDGIITKFQSYAHQEYNTDYFKDKSRLEHFLENGGDILDKNMDFQFVPVDHSFPNYVLNNLKQFVDKGYVKPSFKGESLLPK